MSGYLPAGVTDSHPHFESEPCEHVFGRDGHCEECGEFDPEAVDPDFDPTPWCYACGAMHKSDCHCGPIAEND